MYSWFCSGQLLPFSRHRARRQDLLLVGVAVILAGCSEGAQDPTSETGMSASTTGATGEPSTVSTEIEPTGTSGVPTTGETGSESVCLHHP